MQECWVYLVLFFVGALLCDISFNIVYIWKVWEDIDCIPNQIFFRLHIISLGISMIGLVRMYFYGRKLVGLKYWIAWKEEITNLLKKVKASVTEFLYIVISGS
jgi:hypothetical protein